MYDLAAKALALSAGTFHEEVEDVLANDKHAVVLARHRFQRDGKAKTIGQRTFMKSEVDSWPDASNNPRFGGFPRCLGIF